LIDWRFLEARLLHWSRLLKELFWSGILLIVALFLRQIETGLVNVLRCAYYSGLLLLEFVTVPRLLFVSLLDAARLLSHLLCSCSVHVCIQWGLRLHHRSIRQRNLFLFCHVALRSWLWFWLAVLSRLCLILLLKSQFVSMISRPSNCGARLSSRLLEMLDILTDGCLACLSLVTDLCLRQLSFHKSLHLFLRHRFPGTTSKHGWRF
jgi:hypothetical protein